jgi:hypothetical protein
LELPHELMFATDRDFADDYARSDTTEGAKPRDN